MFKGCGTVDVLFFYCCSHACARIQRGIGCPDPPGKSQVLWVAIQIGVVRAVFWQSSLEPTWQKFLDPRMPWMDTMVYRSLFCVLSTFAIVLMGLL